MDTKNLVFITNPWASSQIRGYQIASRLGCVCNPKNLVDVTNTFVFVKSLPTQRFKNMYVDIVDAYALLDKLDRFPDAKIIAISAMAKDYIANRCNNEVFVILEHHCNFESDVRTRTKVTTVGFIGYHDNFIVDPDLMREKLAKVGLKFIWRFENDFKTREDICEFYKSIDIQLTLRPKFPKHACPPELKNSLKLSNAGSFFVPTVACNEPSYIADYEDCFLIANSIDEAVILCQQLKDNKSLYDCVTDSCHIRAVNFHIDRIIPKYKELLNV